MRVFVLGGTGFVGRHVVHAFLGQGHEVATSVRPGSDASALAGLEVERVLCDLTVPESLRAAFAGRDLVVHTAGVLSLWERHAPVLYRVNVLGTRNVVEACLATGVGRLIYTGSVGIYSGTSEPVPVDEEGAPTTERFHSFHVTSMCLAEAEVFKGVARGLDAVLLHPGLCLGEGDRSMHSSWALVGLAYARLPFAPPGGASLVDVRDVARAHVLAAEKAPRGGNYLLGGANLTNRAFVDLLREELGIRVPPLPVSRAGMRALGCLGEWVARARGADDGTYISLNEAIGRSMSLYWFIDDRKAQRELGHGHSPIRPALRRQLAWLEERGLLPQSGFGLREFLARFFPSPGQLDRMAPP
ncbi:MAG: NAD-dependent epimerase/dehydratase family protein [Planctomycetota bacterium]|nr:MAG: NAD-dependent epimerase/dehydratase family protein [Planctomycetota bacterium]